MKSPIWFAQKTPPIADFARRAAGTMIEQLGIELLEIGPDFLRATMPVDHRTLQPAGLLHGGASVALAETLGSTGANLVVDTALNYCVGLEINANHVRSCREGFVEGVSRPLHIGKSTQLWETLITQNGKLVCVSRLTLSVLERKPA